MPLLKSTYNILTKYDEDELKNTKWSHRTPEMDDKLIPPTWDYNREMKIEDVELWEIIQENSGGFGIYGAWLPHAEFYMITTGIDYTQGPRWENEIPYWTRKVETYYGAGAQQKVVRRAMQLGMSVWIKKVWVDPEYMWLYQEKEPEKKIYLGK